MLCYAYGYVPLLCFALLLVLQALANIIATASTKLLPEKQMNEAALAVKNTLFAAAAAHSYRQQQVSKHAQRCWQRLLGRVALSAAMQSSACRMDAVGHCSCLLAAWQLGR
jgi:hypothetical protein